MGTNLKEVEETYSSEIQALSELYRNHSPQFPSCQASQIRLLTVMPWVVIARQLHQLHKVILVQFVQPEGLRGFHQFESFGHEQHHLYHVEISEGANSVMKSEIYFFHHSSFFFFRPMRRYQETKIAESIDTPGGFLLSFHQNMYYSILINLTRVSRGSPLMVDGVVDHLT